MGVEVLILHPVMMTEREEKLVVSYVMKSECYVWPGTEDLGRQYLGPVV